MTALQPEALEYPGPAQSDFLIHFSGRPSRLSPTPSVPAWIRDLTPAQRLDNILWEQRACRGEHCYGPAAGLAAVTTGGLRLVVGFSLQSAAQDAFGAGNAK